MSNDVHIPIVEEEAHVFKRGSPIERVSVRMYREEEQLVLRDEVRREDIDVTRVPVEREVGEAPPVRVEGDVTIVSVLEERVTVEKRLFVIEELHLKRRSTVEQVEMPTTVRHTRVEIDRDKFSLAGE